MANTVHPTTAMVVVSLDPPHWESPDRLCDSFYYDAFKEATTDFVQQPEGDVTLTLCRGRQSFIQLTSRCRRCPLGGVAKMCWVPKAQGQSCAASSEGGGPLAVPEGMFLPIQASDAFNA